jgi:hypothetical protein
MSVLEALYRLGLSWEQRVDNAAIMKAYKRRMLEFHPDKNPNAQATMISQLLNEAKDLLLKGGDLRQTEDKLRKEHEARIKRETEDTLRKEHEARMKREFEERVAEETRKFREECEQHYERAKQTRRERYSKNRRKRPEGTRAHAKISSYPEGKALMDRMTAFLKGQLEECIDSTNSRLFVDELLDLFVRSHENTSLLDQRLFQRHCRTTLLAIWPNAKYSKFKNKHCYLFIRPKQEARNP